MKKIKIDKEKFINKYIHENMTLPECAAFFGCGKTTLVRFCNKNDIKKPQYLVNKNNSKSSTVHDHGQIRKLYFTDNLTKKEIAKTLNIKEGAVSKVIALSKDTKTEEQKKELLHKIKDSRDEIYDLYINQNKSIAELCNIYGTSETAVFSTLKRHKIKKPEHLRTKLVVQKFIENGKANSVSGNSIKELSDVLGLSITCINKFIRHNKNLNDLELENSLKEISTGCVTSLEEKTSKLLNLDFFNKRTALPYKPDFKIKEDIYLNVDGLYWHSEKVKQDKRYHFNMRKEYEKVNMRILQFREDEIYNKTDIVTSMVNNVINKDIETIYARKCSIKAVSQKEASVFLNKSHLMGRTSARHIALYRNEEIVSLISYKKYKNKLKIERFCSKTNTRVLGGFSKLLKNLEKQEKADKIEYWVDLRYGTGNYLEKLGFKHSHDTLGWKWTDFEKTYNRMHCKASSNKTERENANEKGFYKIYDAGQRLFVKGL